ncbi:hypothetical protein [Mesorhizobium loti]|uniref:hypothetical protein n=1 Tax=Rhizobium loti TaxID=381 RepID=UPI00047D38B1|nr:hypothetical protein [Mesorhizobium loti]
MRADDVLGVQMTNPGTHAIEAWRALDDDWGSMNDKDWTLPTRSITMDWPASPSGMAVAIDFECLSKVRRFSRRKF